MEVIQYVIDHPFASAVLIIPFLYFVLRDIISVLFEKRRAKIYKKKLIASERRVEALYKKMQRNREELMRVVKNVDHRVEDMLLEDQKAAEEEALKKKTKKKKKKEKGKDD